MDLDLNKITSVMLVGIFGTGKSRTVKDILKQARERYANLDILYVDDHKEDFKEVNSTVKDLLNVEHTLTESELKSLHDVVISQQVRVAITFTLLQRCTLNIMVIDLKYKQVRQ